MVSRKEQCIWTKHADEYEEDSEGNIYNAFYIETDCDNTTISTKKESSDCPFCARKIVYKSK